MSRQENANTCTVIYADTVGAFLFASVSVVCKWSTRQNLFGHSLVQNLKLILVGKKSPVELRPGGSFAAGQRMLLSKFHCLTKFGCTPTQSSV